MLKNIFVLEELRACVRLPSGAMFSHYSVLNTKHPCLNTVSDSLRALCDLTELLLACKVTATVPDSQL